MESRKYPHYPNNLNNINSFEDDEDDLPTKEELDRAKELKNRQLNKNNKNNIKDSNNFFDELDDDTDENIQINHPSKYNSINKINKLYINNPNNINSISSNNYNNNNIISNNNNFINNNSFYNNNINENNINNEMDSYLDSNGNIIYRNSNNNSNSSSNNNNSNRNNNSNDVQIQKLDSHRIKVGKNEFEDLTNEAREMQNKEAFEKKILGIYKEERKEEVPEKKPFLERVGDFIENHEEGILTVIDGIGCILLHGPSIVRTINRVDRWIDNIGNNNNGPNQENNILNEVGLRGKEKDLNTILKFLPVWEVRENKKHDNNNSCVVCLCEFQIGDIISALPCCHVFHTECIKNWFKNELSCPVCKFEVTLSSIIGSHNP